jgi:hypothetical protein
MRTNSRAALTVAAALVAATVPAFFPSVVAAAPVPPTTCNVLPADNIWNTDIFALPVNARSAAWLASSGGSTTKLHPDFGGVPYGIPFNVVHTSHQTTNFNFTYWDESDPVVATQQPQGPYPYGTDLLREAPTDSHLLSIDQDTCKLYETWATDSNGPSTAGSGAIFDLNSNQLRPAGWTSADAAGLPIFPGLVRQDEVQAGFIGHAIRFTVQRSDTSYVWPARHQAGSASDANLPPMGARFRLKASFPISGFGAEAQVVLTAMKHFGLIVADNGSNWYFQGTMDPVWNSPPYPTMISQLKTVPASAFEAIDESALMVNPNSGQARKARDRPVSQGPSAAGVSRVGVSQSPSVLPIGLRRPLHFPRVVRLMFSTSARRAFSPSGDGADFLVWASVGRSPASRTVPSFTSRT